MSEPAPDLLLAARKEPGWVWVPNDLLDRYASTLGPRGVFVYLVLARMATLKHYPSRRDLCRYCQLNSTALDKFLGLLRYYGLLNDHDLDAIAAAPDRLSPARRFDAPGDPSEETPEAALEVPAVPCEENPV